LGKAVLFGVDGITVLDALVIAGSRFHDPNEPMANMRANGVRSLAIHCHRCLHEVILNVDHLPGHLTVPTFGSKMARIKCGSIGAPAVKMFVLSATGDPVAFVNLFSVDMMDSSVVLARLRRLQACRRPEQLQCFDF
jgi:hypothetical protein